LFIKTLL